MVQVCQGTKTKYEMMHEAIEQYKEMFTMANSQINKVVAVCEETLEMLIVRASDHIFKTEMGEDLVLMVEMVAAAGVVKEVALVVEVEVALVEVEAAGVTGVEAVEELHPEVEAVLQEAEEGRLKELS